MAQWLRSLVALPEDPGWVPRPNMAANNWTLTPVPEDLMPTSGSCELCMKMVHWHVRKKSTFNHETIEFDQKQPDLWRVTLKGIEYIGVDV